MLTKTKEQVRHLKQLSYKMLEDADTCEHSPLQQKLREAAAELLRKADEIDHTAEQEYS